MLTFRDVTRIVLSTVVGLTCTLAVGADPPVKTVKPDGTPNRAAWMAQSRFGVMTHYLISPQGNSLAEKTADLNRIVDAFDVEAYVKQIEEAQADWVIFTLCQGTGFLSSRCEFLDKSEAGYSPTRDLIPELGRKLHEKGKRLIIYTPGAHTGADPNVKRILGLGGEGYADRHNAFIRNYSLKMGKHCDGWWFDSCGKQDNAAWEKDGRLSRRQSRFRHRFQRRGVLRIGWEPEPHLPDRRLPRRRNSFAGRWQDPHRLHLAARRGHPRFPQTPSCEKPIRHRSTTCRSPSSSTTCNGIAFCRST